MNEKTKYTKELLEKIVIENFSISGVLRALNLKEAGGTHNYISKKIKKYQIDTTHFRGQGNNCGINRKGGNSKKEWSKILVKRENGLRQKSFLLRRAMIESGIKYKCKCGLEDQWMNKEIRLQVNHKNGNWLDDTKENLEFLCPNCHSQTENFNGSKGLSELTSSSKHSKNYRKQKLIRKHAQVA